MSFKWDRRFGDGATAPAGSYNVKVVAVDNLGHSTIENASVRVILKSSSRADCHGPSAFPSIAHLDSFIYRHCNPNQYSNPSGCNQGFGSTLEPQVTATPKPAIAPTPRATPTQNKVVEWLKSLFPLSIDEAARTLEISSLGSSTQLPDSHPCPTGVQPPRSYRTDYCLCSEEKRRLIGRKGQTGCFGGPRRGTSRQNTSQTNGKAGN